MNRYKRALVGAAVAGSMLVGGVAGAAIYAATSLTASAADNTLTAASPSPGTAPSGKFVPNEDPTHEKGESAAREAQENAGQVSTVP
jgi:uncharacterized membrane protein